MNEVNRARWKLLGGIFLVIILIHIVAISCIVATHRTPEEEPAATQTQQTAAPAAQQQPAAPAVPERQPENKKKSGGFWSWLFGGGDKQQPESEPEEVRPPRVYRYKKPSENPLFGKPFNYALAKTGDFSEKEVPGSRGATSGIMVDLGTRTVLWEKNSSKQVPIASMVKMMTLLVAFEALEDNPSLSLESPVKISPEVLKVARTGIVWLDPRETLPLSDLMKAAAIKSANDAAVQIALFFGNGDQEAFITKMNAKALELGMTGTHFVSPCGLPDRKKGNSLSTARDMVLLGVRLLEYPKYLEWSTTKLDYMRTGEKRTMLNATNRLINPHWPGVDGLKTGYTDDAGYCLTFSVLRDGRRIVGCVTGFPSARSGRDPFARKLIDWGYRRAAELEQKK